MACRFVQAREPATGVIVIHISTGPDCTGAINNLSGLIEFKGQLGQVVEIAVWMRAHQERNLRFGEPDFSGRFHRKCSSANSFQRYVAAMVGNCPCGAVTEQWGLFSPETWLQSRWRNHPLGRRALKAPVCQWRLFLGGRD
jgi:hypothetical protein